MNYVRNSFKKEKGNKPKGKGTRKGQPNKRSTKKRSGQDQKHKSGKLSNNNQPKRKNTNRNGGFKLTQPQTKFVNFGFYLNEFIASKTMKGQELYIKYEKDSENLGIWFTFKPLLENGVAFGEKVTYDKDTYMQHRVGLVGSAILDKRWINYASKLDVRLGLNLAQAKPQVDFYNVKRFVKQHLSPYEQVVMELNDNEWHLLDIAKFRDLHTGCDKIINGHYAKPAGRVGYLVKSINDKTGTVPPVKAIEWASKGILPTTKNSLINECKIITMPSNEFTETINQTIQSVKGLENNTNNNNNNNY